MNIERVNALARFMRLMEIHRPEAFDIREWGNDLLLSETMVEEYWFDDEAGMLHCEAPMCLAGWAVYLDKPAWRQLLASGWMTVQGAAKMSLGLTDEQSRRLFMPTLAEILPAAAGVLGYPCKEGTLVGVARVLEELARTGEVDWYQIGAISEVSNG